MNSRTLRSLLVSWVCVVSCQFVAAQEPPKPGPEHDLLKQFEGTWDAVVKFGAIESKGVANYKMELGGKWLVSEFTGEFGGEKFQGRGIDGFDQDKKKYIGVWIDSMTTSPMIAEGTYDAQTKMLTYLSDGKDPQGKPAKIKSVTALKDKDHHSFQMFMTGDDGKEQLMMTIEYTRRK